VTIDGNSSFYLFDVQLIHFSGRGVVVLIESECCACSAGEYSLHS